MTTYNEVAESYKMPFDMKIRFLRYMRTRWGKPEDEERHCMVGYAQEWATRFINGVEFGCSDSVGREILRKIDADPEMLVINPGGKDKYNP